MRFVFAGLGIALTGCEVLFPLEPPGDGPSVDSTKESCPADYLLGFDTSFYRFQTVPANWTDAEKICEGDTTTKITHLASPETLSEHRFLRANLSIHGIDEPAWLGVARESSAVGTLRTSFLRLDGERQLLGWQDFQPDNSTAEEYAAIIDPNQDLVDIAYQASHMFVCECDGKARTVTFDFEMF